MEDTEIQYEDLRNMLSVKDLSLIYTFYKKIEKHNLLYDKYNNIQNKIGSEKDIEIIKRQIKESYHDCFQYAKRMLRELSWSNYKSSGISFVSSWKIVKEQMVKNWLYVLKNKWFRIYLLIIILLIIFIFINEMIGFL